MFIKLSYFIFFGFLVATSFQKAYGQVVNYDTEITVADDGVKTTKRTVLIQINSKEENWLSHVELNHNPGQKFKFDYARILDFNGDVKRKLKKKELVTRNVHSYQTFYQDDLITEFDLFWNKYPYRVEYSYSIEEEEYLYLVSWSPIYKPQVVTMNGSLEVSIPSDYSIRVNSTEELIPEEINLDERKILRWYSKMIKSDFSREMFSPALKYPNVKIVPEEFKYGVNGKTESWSSFGNWMDQLNRGTDQLSPQEIRTIEKLVNGVQAKNEIVKSIYHYLQDRTTYVNVAIDVGGLKSYPASYVCENKYGDCKALTTYMKAMLKSVGIESFYSIVKAGEKNTALDLDFPSQQFNHVILMVPNESDTLWLENTSRALPFDYLGTFTQSRYALAVNGEKSQLIKTPELSIDDVLIERNYHFQLTEMNEGQIGLQLTLRGKEFEEFRYFVSEKNEKRQIDELIENAGVKNFKMNRWDLIDFHRDSTFLETKLSGASSSIIREVGSFQVIDPLRIPLPDFEEPDQRKTEVLINFPINRFDKSVYDLVDFEQSKIQVPDDIKIENAFGSYNVSNSINDGELIVVEKFTLFANKISIEKYRDFYEFIESIDTYKRKTRILIK